MSSPTLVQFIRENQSTLERIHSALRSLNNEIEFIDCCKFVYYHTY